MGLSTDVNLPRDVTPVFPDRCVGCGGAAPGGVWSFSSRTASWLGLFTLWIGRRHTVDVPCCDPCRTRLSRDRRRRDVSNLVVTIVVVAAIVPSVAFLDRSYRKPVAAVLAVLAMLPTYLVQLFHAPPFDLHVRRKDVDHEFGDAAYAREFHALNEAAGATIED